MKTTQFYIDGAFVDAPDAPLRDVICPATLEPVGQIAMGGAADVDRAVKAARAAFDTALETGTMPREDRLAMLRRILEGFDANSDELARLTSLEMGSPITFSREAQMAGTRAHIVDAIRILESYRFERKVGETLWTQEPIGVCALITPWNFPVLQIMTKLLPALATGCAVVLKPSEYGALSPMLLARILHEAGVPRGMFNLINGDGARVGAAMAEHPGVDMVSFTGSTRAGVAVARNAAATVKRVHQELGGNSANIIVAGVDLAEAVTRGTLAAYRNAGQSCTAPCRMLVPRALHAEAAEIAKRAAESVAVGDVLNPATTLGPVVNEIQHARVAKLIEAALAEGATLVAGGPGLPEGGHGYHIRPTVLADVTPDMTPAREEIFGPVVSLMPYDSLDEAIAIANDTPYGLAAWVQCADPVQARGIARRLRCGQVTVNAPAWDSAAPFGGFKQSGNGRECGEAGFEAFTETKATLGLGAA